MFSEVLDGEPILMSTLCYMIAATQNYVVNHYWTFRENTYLSKPSLKKWFAFLTGSSAGLAVNLIVLQCTIDVFDYITISQALGLVAGFVFNYITAKYIVFSSGEKN